MSTLSIGISGLNAASIGLNTTSHNIANASTPGYNRQVIVQGTNIPVLSGAGFIGQGTNVETVKRVYSQFLSQQVLSAQTSASSMDSYLQQIQQIDGLFADSSAGLSPALTDFFKGVQEVAANPASIPARQAMLSSAQALVSRFQSLGQRLNEIGGGINGQIGSEVGQINSYATQIADINRRILLARAGGLNQEPNDLLDQRDQMIADLNKSVAVSTITQSDGSLNVFFGNGQPLVVGEQAYTLVAQPASADPTRITVAMRMANGSTVELPEAQIVGGTLGGLIAFRSQSLDSIKTSLDQVAITLAGDFNAQHKLGMDLNGALGGDFFSMGPVAGATGIGVAITDARKIAAGAPIATSAPTTNTGNASIDAGSVTSPASLPLGGTVTIQYNGATNQFVVSGPVAAGPFAYVPGQPISFAGMSVTITGTPANGDRFLIKDNQYGTADNRNANLLAALQTRTTMLGGTASYQSAYSQIVSAVGNKTREVQVVGQAQQRLADAAEANRQQASGVNLDEEAGNLLRYQQAYQAAAKVIQTSSKLFDDLLAVMR
jgi:flagellar hook-associated protein 1 FlgK